LPLEQNESIDFENANKNVKLVTKRDGKLEPYSEMQLTIYLESMLEGLNR